MVTTTSKELDALALDQLSARIAQPFESIARQYLKCNQVKEAFRCIEKIIALNPNQFQPYSQYVTELYESGQYPLAMELFHRWLTIQDTLAKKKDLESLGIRVLREDWAGNIGHIALLDLYVKLMILDLLPPRHTIVSIPPSMVSNPCYLDYWRRYLPNIVTNPSMVEYLSRGMQSLTEHATMMKLIDGNFHPLHSAAMLAEKLWEDQKRPPLLTLTDTDHDRGTACLAAMGIPKDAWFVGLHVREGGAGNRAGHNADIMTYIPAMEEIVRRGGWVLRMGNPSMKLLPHMDQVIDYAHSPFRSDWMDVFIWSKSRFFVGTTSGPIGVPPTFGVPCVQTNWCPPAFRHWYSKDICIPKLFRRNLDGTWVGFTQVLHSSLGFATSLDHFASQGVTLVDNTPDELSAVVMEMMDVQEGVRTYSAEDQDLQRQYNRIRPQGGYPLPSANRIGQAFLRKHRSLLEVPAAGTQIE